LAHPASLQKANRNMVEATTAIVVSAVLFGAFVLFWILTMVFCKCRESSEHSSSYIDRRFTPEEERMIRQNSERRAKQYKEGAVDL